MCTALDLQSTFVWPDEAGRVRGCCLDAPHLQARLTCDTSADAFLPEIRFLGEVQS